MVTRELHYWESNTGTTTTTSEDKISESFVPTANTDYLYFMRCSGSMSSTSSDFECLFREIGAGGGLAISAL